MGTTMAQTNLRIRPVWSVPLMFTAITILAMSRISRLELLRQNRAVWIIPGCKPSKTSFLVMWLIYLYHMLTGLPINTGNEMQVQQIKSKMPLHPYQYAFLVSKIFITTRSPTVTVTIETRLIFMHVSVDAKSKAIRYKPICQSLNLSSVIRQVVRLI